MIIYAGEVGFGLFPLLRSTVAATASTDARAVQVQVHAERTKKAIPLRHSGRSGLASEPSLSTNRGIDSSPVLTAGRAGIHEETGRLLPT